MNHDDTTNTMTAMGAGCRRLDAYMDGDLAPQERLAFEKHLSLCAECREAIEQLRWVDSLLQSGDAAEEAVFPGSARVNALKAISSARHRTRVRRSLIAGTAAAASIVMLAAWQFSSRPSAPGFARGLNHQTIAQDDATPRQSRGLQAAGTLTEATFVTDGDAIAVPLVSDDAQVSIVQVYPTTTTERRWRRQLYLSAGAAGQDGG
jgi:anti-sigma factor RsiW